MAGEKGGGSSNQDSQTFSSAGGNVLGLYPDTEHLAQQRPNPEGGQPDPASPPRKFMGRYDSPEQLEEFARQQQGINDRLMQNPLLQIAPLFEQYPELWDDLEAAAKAREAGLTPPTAGNTDKGVPTIKAEDFLVDDGMGGKVVDHAKMTEAMNKALQSIASSAGNVRRNAPDPTVINKMTELELKQRYLESGIPVEELAADLGYAQRLGQADQISLLGVARRLRLMEEGANKREQFPYQPAVLMGGGAGYQMTASPGDAEADQIVRGRRTIKDLRHRPR